MPQVFERYYVNGIVDSGMVEHFYQQQKEIVFSDSVSKTKKFIPITKDDFSRVSDKLKEEGLCVAEGFYVIDEKYKTNLIKEIYLHNSSVVRIRIPSAHSNVSWMIVSIVSESKEKLEETARKLNLPLEKLASN